MGNKDLITDETMPELTNELEYTVYTKKMEYYY